ncbi:SPOR domain-containing protein [Tenacibaculum insulae]|uniref:SPOR domain-containing protein n=1 Tax=Tenacibaculum insulae TaxID=2029677 RepID=UPI003AB34F52
MPFIEEDKFKLLLEDLDKAEVKKEEAENELGLLQEEYTSFKKKSNILPIILGVLLGVSIGAAVFFYINSKGVAFPSADEIATIKKNETKRVLDSIKRADARKARKNKSGLGKNNLDKTINQVSKSTSGETMYSVQVGVFSENRFPLLSSQTIPSTVIATDGYFKYSLGLYTSLGEAKELRKELVKVGFKDAFVASYIDGKRQKIHN